MTPMQAFEHSIKISDNIMLGLIVAWLILSILAWFSFIFKNYTKNDFIVNAAFATFIGFIVWIIYVTQWMA